MKVVIWFGPVATSQVTKARLPDADKFIVVGGGCPPGGGDPSCQGSSYFASLADTWFDGKNYLPKLLRSKGVDPLLEPEVYIGSFSAGHGAVKKLCMSPDDRRLIQGIALADSTYCAWPNKVPAFSEGYVRYCVDAVTRPRLFVATASANEDPAGNTPAGNKCMFAIRDEVEKRVGAKFAPTTFWPAGIDPQPVAVWQLGNCILADYGSRVTHSGHAIQLAPQVWSQLVTPWTASPQSCFTVAALGSTSTVAPPSVAPGGQVCTLWGRWPAGAAIPPQASLSRTDRVFAVGVGAVLAYGAARIVQHRMAR
jgi:hypothetical protein